jgi:hypothetical protein
MADTGDELPPMRVEARGHQFTVRFDPRAGWSVSPCRICGADDPQRPCPGPPPIWA